MVMKWVRKTIAKSAGGIAVSDALAARFNERVSLAAQAGIRVDGISLARAGLNETTLKRIEDIVLNDASLSYYKKELKISRIEFIMEGALPPELLGESPLKNVTIYKQNIGYDLCKSCRLCIEVCPKNVYSDSGTGQPDRQLRRSEECTGPVQCGKCVDICPEKTISVHVVEPSFTSSLYVLLDNPFEKLNGEGEKALELYVENPLEAGKPLTLLEELNPNELALSLKILNASHFYPVLEFEGETRHLVDSLEPERDIETWCAENYRDPELTLQSVRLFLTHLPSLNGLREGKYDFKQFTERITDEILYENGSGGDSESLLEIVKESYLSEPFYGAKRRPIGGILPSGTSPSWKTPYGDEIPYYSHTEKCLGPECSLCITNCPEGGGGERSAIRMVPIVPAGVIPSIVRGFDTHLVRLDGQQKKARDAEKLTGKTPFEFVVQAEYCKACGVCIAYCPHEVIEATPRIFDLRAKEKA